MRWSIRDTAIGVAMLIYVANALFMTGVQVGAAAVALALA